MSLSDRPFARGSTPGSGIAFLMAHGCGNAHNRMLLTTTGQAGRETLPADPLLERCRQFQHRARFDGLPGATKEAIYARMWEILSGKDQNPKYRKLTPELRADIVSILVDTRSGLPPYFQPLP